MGNTTSQIEDGILPRCMDSNTLSTSHYIQPRYVLFRDTGGNRFQCLRKRVKEMKLAKDVELAWMNRIEIDEYTSQTQLSEWWNGLIMKFKNSISFCSYVDYLMVKCLMILWLTNHHHRHYDSRPFPYCRWSDFETMYLSSSSTLLTTHREYVPTIGQSFDDVQRIALKFIRNRYNIINDDNDNDNIYSYSYTYHRVCEFVRWFCIVNNVSFWIPIYQYEPHVWKEWIQLWATKQSISILRLCQLPGLIPHVVDEINGLLSDITNDRNTNLSTSLSPMCWILIQHGIWNEDEMSALDDNPDSLSFHENKSESPLMVVCRIYCQYRHILHQMNCILFHLKTKPYKYINDGLVEFPQWKHTIQQYQKCCSRLPVFVLYEFQHNHPLHQFLHYHHCPSSSNAQSLFSSRLPTQASSSSTGSPHLQSQVAEHVTVDKEGNNNPRSLSRDYNDDKEDISPSLPLSPSLEIPIHLGSPLRLLLPLSQPLPLSTPHTSSFSVSLSSPIQMNHGSIHNNPLSSSPIQFEFKTHSPSPISSSSNRMQKTVLRLDLPTPQLISFPPESPIHFQFENNNSTSNHAKENIGKHNIVSSLKNITPKSKEILLPTSLSSSGFELVLSTPTSPDTTLGSPTVLE